MNRVLTRQLRRLGLSAESMPTDLGSWAALLERIDAYYDESDRARYLLERSMEISEREMQQLNAEIRDLSRRDLERREQLSRHNFHELPVAAWLEDFTLAVMELDKLRAAGVSSLSRHIETRPEYLRSLVDSVIVVDCNQAVCDLVGAERADLMGPVDATALGADSLSGWQHQFQTIWEGHGRVEIEFRGERTDGSSFPAALKWSAAEIDGSFDYSRVMVVIIDMTDRMAAEERMRDLVLAKDEFLASVSHELRTPLTSVVGYAELLREVGGAPTEHRQMIESIAEQAADLADIVDDLLVGARSELGELRVSREPFDASEVVEHLAAAYPNVRTDTTGPGVWAEGDPGRVRQVLRNLLTNAHRYGGASVTVSIRTTDDAVLIGVSDDGPALSGEMAARIFDRYFRSDRDRARPASVGLGLTISRDLARRMGGDLTYRHDGQRAHFELRLPAARDTGLRAAG